jgi:methionyl-tRNA formyltransferase
VNHVRSLDPEPGAWTTLRGQRLKVYRAEAAPGEVDLTPGEIVSEKLLVAGTGDVPLALVDVQPAGKRRMTGEELARGLRLAPGERFG